MHCIIWASTTTAVHESKKGCYLCMKLFREQSIHPSQEHRICCLAYQATDVSLAV